MIADEMNRAGTFDQFKGNLVIILQHQIQVRRVKALTQSKGAEDLTNNVALEEKGFGNINALTATQNTIRSKISR